MPLQEYKRAEMGEAYEYELIDFGGQTVKIPNCLAGVPYNHDHSTYVYYAKHNAEENPLYQPGKTASVVCSACRGTFVVSPALTQEGIEAFLIKGGEIGKPFVEFRPFSGHAGN